MNYIKEINEFYVRLETSPLSVSAISLWYALMHVNNRTRWREEFSVAASVLCMKAGLPLSTFKRARLELRDQGFIFYRPQGNRAPMYEMISLVEMLDGDVVDADVSQRPKQERKKLPEKVESGFSEKEDISRMGAEVLNRDEENVLRVNEGVLADASAHSKELLEAEGTNQLKGSALLEMFRECLYSGEATAEKDDKWLCFSTYCYYEEHVGEPSKYVTDELYAWAEKMGDTLVYEAIVRAIESGHLHWNYVRGILRNWQKDKLESVEDVLAAEHEFRQGRHLSRGKKDDAQERIVPEWMKERSHVG